MPSRRRGRLAIALAFAVLAGIACRESPRAPAASPTPAALPQAQRKVLYWYDPMVPGSKFDKPGKSPFMDMQLVPKYADEETAPAGGVSAASVTLSPQAIRAVGVATQPVLRETLSQEVRAAGTIEIDETRQARVAARVAGRVEKLYANFTGQPVSAGAPLYSLYSPELVATQREYLLALDNRESLSGATPEAVRPADALVVAARDRLSLWGIGAAQIAALERSRTPELSLAFASPITGVVLQKEAIEGQYVSEGTELYQLADLSRVWLVARVYEHEVGRLRVGQPVEATVSALPSRTFRGRIAFVDPVLDAATRSARVRAELPNEKGELKPGMFADARIEVPAALALTVPKAAVIDTGTRKVVYVETAPNTFSPRDVRTGEASADRVAILEGLREGERVVAAANFFIDAQTQLSAGAAAQYSGALDVKTTPEAKTTPNGEKP
ncbi:MAG TPA: efflux RND transporter periplasmic adaptor subunit [Thermoanaerobaculia bacterium]